ncbi:flagellar protein FlaG [Campylobacter sp. VicNov18]|uniref:FlaG family protein n=1 Tax=Campylobacter bilis TaxID=2691918 RepID=UPI00130E7202|nr:FlaG family protein [Campylobacter bilis]MPV64120.1 flagellar biosynthesis protein FlaG [Campylobacter hepaticus]MBM0637623.1 flagellar biosynthesis protein FlaG [Campylobacter bilis]MCC8278349.1 flagellar protein FlaG [Campylobacter bilis]MCC8299852.1 flagellar protein FlaG [Campylobacter bilis]MCC8301258.1 flagellar protein FlaG [Campylobacter bilis]
MEILKTKAQMDPSLLNTGHKTEQTFNIPAHKNQAQGGSKDQKDQNTKDQLAKIIEKLNEQMDSLGTNVRFGYSDKIGSMYVKVTEKSTGKEIRQIPSEEAMKLAEYFKDVIGMIFDKES